MGNVREVTGEEGRGEEIEDEGSAWEKGRGREEGRSTGHHKPFGRGREGRKGPKHTGATTLTFQGHVTSSDM